MVIPLYQTADFSPTISLAAHSLNSPEKYILTVYTWESEMKTAKVFRSGNSQAVRLPKEFRLKSKEVEVFRRGNEIVLREKDADLSRAFELLASLPSDFTTADRKDDFPQARKGL